MDGVQSFEQRSLADYGTRCNRVIVVKRHEPSLEWQETSERSTRLVSKSNLDFNAEQTSDGFCSRLFYCCARRESDRFELSGSRRKKRLSETSALARSSQSGAIFDFGPFSSNMLKTSKYTLLNFLPKNLYEQFRRMANLYFLITAIIQVLIPFSPVGPSTSLIPLAFVISTTAIKQAYEDYLRHKLDNEVNNRMCSVLRANRQLVKVRSKDIRVGDIIYVENNEEIPCDMILLASSGAGDRCYITTANLDGETSLKSRTCFQIHQQVGNIEKIDQTLLVLECEQPNATLYEFNGSLRAPRDEEAHKRLLSDLRILDEFRDSNNKHNTIDSRAQPTWQKRLSILSTIFHRIKSASWRSKLNKQVTSEQLQRIGANNLAAQNRSEHVEISLDISNLLLRASRLRNTSFVYGLAIYTGPDTRLAHNSQVKPNKFSSLESRVNMFLLIAFLLLILLTVISSLRYRQPQQWYLSNLKRADSFSQILMAHFVLYNYLVPISLYVTLEFVKFLGTISVLEDKKLRTNISSTSKGQEKEQQQKSTGPQCNSSDLNEDLGQVEVLFSDKTGTLTENKMLFTACSIDGRLFRCISSQLYEQPEGLCRMPMLNVARKLANIELNRYGAMAHDLAQAASPHSSSRMGAAGSGANRSSLSSSERMAQLPPHQRPFDHRIRPSMKDLRNIDPIDKYEEVVQFFVALCLCSTITLNEQKPIEDCLPDKALHYDYQSASPDEESLISAAAQFGVIVCKASERECYIAIKRAANTKLARSNRGIFKCLIETKNSNEKFLVRHFERLITFEFNSTRKKMSVFYKDCDNDSLVIMFTKGSESVLDCIGLSSKLGSAGKEAEPSPSPKSPQLSLSRERIINLILAHFEAFSKSGLRTMLVAARLISSHELDKINGELSDARMLPVADSRETRLDKLYRRTESGMNLVGATAVEDSLQEGVPETIANLKEAGIKVWLLTGDKVETAVSVAYLCKLLDRNMNLLHLVRQQDASSCKDLLKSFEAQIRKAMVYGDEEEETSSLGGGGGSQIGPRQSAGKRPLAHVKLNGAKHNGKSTPTNEMDMPRFALIADGRSLHYAMKHARPVLEYVSTNCVCVLGCRLSPLQKAEIVDMIKQSAGEPITAAIGDGANDVSMIQEAHVGIGISGKEGRQAVNSSDFSINRFYMIRRLFFVHGHLFYYRTAITIHYFFYKNLMLIMPQFLYSFYNLSSSTSLYHPIMLISFNMVFTAFPILLFGLSEHNMSEDLLENYPKLYRINHRNKLMRYSCFVVWLLMGSLQAILSFYFIYFIWGSHTPFLESGKMTGMIGFSSILFTALVCGITLKLYLISKSRTYCFAATSILSCLSVPAIFLTCSLFDLTKLFDDNSLYGQFITLIKSPTYWLAILTSTATMIIPDIAMHIRDQITYYRTLNSIVN